MVDSAIISRLSPHNDFDGSIKRTKAFAKINLTLKIMGRRDDGYHELNSLVAFAGCHDLLSLMPHDQPIHLNIRGALAHQLGNDADNLILKAARALNPKRVGHFDLIKRLPIGGGIGGGSADAAAALRLLAMLNGIPINSPELMRIAATVGADVPVCIDQRTRFMCGIGEILSEPIIFPTLYAVLVTPPVHMATATVFKNYNHLEYVDLERAHLNDRVGLSVKPHIFPDYESVITFVRHVGNDLIKSASSLAPVLDQVMHAIQGTINCDYVSMSGSGSTCFGLYKNCTDAKNAAKMIKSFAPDWWVKSTCLR